jgi:spore germination cell wall hydrolase CwlJ-like protein
MVEKSLKSAQLLIGIAIVVMITKLAISFVPGNKTNVHTEHLSAQEVEKSLNCLALNIYREAGNEPFQGKVAVAQVTLNRVEDGRFGKDVCGVVYKKNRNPFTQKIVCQFSWYCDSKHRTRPVNKELYGESHRVAKMVLLENFRLESIENALYYHADYINPGWKNKRINQIGTHIFYE